jgi:ZIP family zinc transporter
MSASQTTLLGAIAGSTIFLGLPLGRVQTLRPRWRAFLSVLSAGILLFIFWDVVSAAADGVEGALNAAKGGGSWGRFVLYATMLASGFVAGTLGLSAVERTVLRRRPLPPISGGSAASAVEAGFDVAAIAEQRRQAALTLGMLIAVAIGVHNFSEGIAIGVSARAGEIALAGTLVVGFALHNATEGFGIIGPLDGARASWRWLGIAGLVGGGPTFLGTLVGYRISAEWLQLAFLALAAGAILYVVGELWTAAAKRAAASKNLILAGIVAGFLLGYASDLVLVYAGV